MNKIVFTWLAAALLTATLPTIAAEKLERIRLAGPSAAVSHPLVRMVDTNALADVTEQMEFQLWKNPDQMRALTLNGATDFIATPSNVAANLYNRGANLRLLNISVWGILWMVSRESDLETLADFQGKEIAIPFRGDMPDIIFSELAERQGLNPRKDFKLRYVANPMDAMQLLLTRRVDHALLAEPAVSMVLRKTDSFPAKMIAPDIYRSVDLQQEWGRLFERRTRIPQAGIALLNQNLDPHVIDRFREEYRKATQWCLDNPQEAGQLVARHIPMLTAEAITDSIKVSQLQAVDAIAARDELTLFYNILRQRTPALVGGKLPDAHFYYP